MNRLHHKGSVTLYTARMTLRAFTLRDDWAMFENWAGDPEVARYMRGRAHSSVAITRQVLESWCCHGRRKSYHWAMVPSGWKQPVGSISFVTFDEAKREAEVGYTLSRRFWGKGLVPEALSVVLEFGRKEIGLLSFYAQLFEGNTQSVRVLEKCGFSFSARFPDAVTRNDGTPGTVLIYRRSCGDDAAISP